MQSVGVALPQPAYLQLIPLAVKLCTRGIQTLDDCKHREDPKLHTTRQLYPITPRLSLLAAVPMIEA